jgi:hypothetical protein
VSLIGHLSGVIVGLGATSGLSDLIVPSAGTALLLSVTAVCYFSTAITTAVCYFSDVLSFLCAVCAPHTRHCTEWPDYVLHCFTLCHSAFLSYLERDTCLSALISRLPAYIRSTDKDMGVEWASGVWETRFNCLIMY